MKYIALGLDLVGAAAVVVGVALLSAPAAFIVAGALCVLLAAGLERRK